MKYFGLAVTCLILIFWSTMNTLLVERQLELSQLGLYQKKVNRFLDASRRRERWMSIYKKDGRRRRKLGYSGSVLEVRSGSSGWEYYTDHESVIDLELFGRGAQLLEGLVGKGNLRVQAQLVQDAEMKPLTMTVELKFPNERYVVIQGERQEDRFVLRARHGGLDIPPLSLPLEKLALGNSLVPDLPLAGLREGESFQVKTFDPIFFTARPVTLEVVSFQAQEIDGLLVDVYTLEWTLGGVKNTALVTRDGTVLRMKLGPPFEGISLRHESRETATKGLD